LVSLLQLLRVVARALFNLFPRYKFFQMAVELACLNCRFFLTTQTFSLLESLGKQSILLLACSLYPLLALSSVLVSFLLQSDVLGISGL